MKESTRGLEKSGPQDWPAQMYTHDEQADNMKTLFLTVAVVGAETVILFQRGLQREGWAENGYDDIWLFAYISNILLLVRPFVLLFNQNIYLTILKHIIVLYVPILSFFHDIISDCFVFLCQRTW